MRMHLLLLLPVTAALVSATVVPVAAADTDPNAVEGPCAAECAMHKSNDTFYCENSRCREFPEAPESSKEIHLQHNLITRIPELDYYYLELLNLTDNLITGIGADVLYGCDNLIQLWLSYNRIRDLDSSSLAGLTKLEKLYMDHNDISTIPDDMFYKVKSSLAVLDLSYNKLSSLNEATFSDIDVVYLHLSGNKLTEIADNYFLGLTYLKFLYLDQNKIEVVHNKSFYECRALESIDLNNNQIEKIERNAFLYTESLQVLHLTGNKLKTLHKDTFKFLTEEGKYMMHSIYLDFNPLETLPDGVFPHTLSKISLSYLPELTNIPKYLFDGVSKLEEVYINNNPRLSSVDELAFGGFDGTQVNSLELRNNSLSVLEPWTLRWRSLSNLDLRDNPWYCDCQFKWVLSEVHGLPNATLSKTECAFPDLVSGKTMDTLTEDMFTCNMFYMYRMKLMRIILAGLVIATLTAICVFSFIYRKKCCKCCKKDDFQYKTVYNSLAAEEAEVDINIVKNKGRHDDVEPAAV